MCLPLGDYTSRYFKGMGKIWSQICKCRFKFCNSWELASTNWKWGSEYYALSFSMWARVLKTWAHRGCHLADNKDCTRIQNQKHKPPARAPEQTERTMNGNKHGPNRNGELTQMSSHKHKLGAHVLHWLLRTRTTPFNLSVQTFGTKEPQFLWISHVMPAMQWVTSELERRGQMKTLKPSWDGGGDGMQTGEQQDAHVSHHDLKGPQQQQNQGLDSQ